MDFCNESQYGKQVKSSFYSSVLRKANVLNLVHSNVCRMPVMSMGGAVYFVMFIDYYSHKIWVYLLK